MTEENNVTELPGSGRAEGPGYDPKYALSVPTIEDTVEIAGALARNSDDSTLALLASEKAERGIYDALLRAIGDPTSRNEVLMVFANLWKLPVDVESPHEDWDYDPDPKKVESGNQLSREEMWRTLSRSSRRRIAKRIELGKLPYSAWGEFYKAFRATVDLPDFLSSVAGSMTAQSGGSTTGSPSGTGGDSPA